MQLFPMTAKGIESRRRGQVLVGPIDLTLDGTGACVVVGPNGAGKTTLLRLLHGTARLSAGQINWACPTDAARHHQGFVFQRPVMLRRTVMQNLIYPLRLRGVPLADARDRARDWAGRVGLADMLDRAAPVLSGGEQQKLEILTHAKSTGTRLILSTHDMGQARRLADQVLFLLGGRIHESGPAETFFNQPETPQARAFLRGDIVE